MKKILLAIDESRVTYGEESIRLFEQTFIDKGVRRQVYRVRDSPSAKDLIEESRFADLIVIKTDLSFDNTPAHPVKDVLAGAECPVIIMPFSLSGIEQVVFTYDGSRSAVFAIKQFTYLFPELADKKAIVLQVNDNRDMPLSEKEKIADLLKTHYSGIGFQVLQGNTHDELFHYFLDKTHTLVVMGAFGRSWLSNLIKPSSASLLLKRIHLPFFIAHH